MANEIFEQFGAAVSISGTDIIPIQQGVSPSAVYRYTTPTQLAEYIGLNAVVWGNITGILSDQTDLQEALDEKVAVGSNISQLTNNAGYITTASLANYLTISAAESTYLTIANAASTYLTQANAATTYVPVTRTVNGQALSSNVTINDITGNAGTVTTINGRLAAGAGINLTGVGTAASPYTIVATGGTQLRFAANNTRFSTNFANSSNWVQNCWTKHRTGPSGFSKGLYASFINGLMSTNSEQNAFYDFVLRAGIYVPSLGKFVQGVFLSNSGTQVTLAKDWGTDTAYFNIAIPPNTDFYITNRRVAADNGVAGTYSVLTTTAGRTFRADGIISGTNPADDFTLGVGIAYGAGVLAPVINASGVITSIPIDPLRRGTGYSGGLQLAPYYGGADINTVGANMEGTTSWSGYGNTSGGSISSVTTLGGGTGFNPNNPPSFHVGGTGTAATGFGSNTATWGPSAIFGEADSYITSVLLIGDSITAGYGSVDGAGDINGNFGIYERALNNRCGVLVDACSGNQAAGYTGNSTRRQAFYNYLKNLGVVVDKFAILLGTNDFVTNANSDVVTAVQSANSGIAATIQAVWSGADPILGTIPPVCTTTDGGITTANQTVWQTGFGGTPNFAANGRVATYNTSVRNGTAFAAQRGFVDAAIMLSDSSAREKWRVAGEFPLVSATATAFANPETVGATPNTMIHPSFNVGIPYGVNNLDLSAILQPISSRIVEVPTFNYQPVVRESGEGYLRALPSASAISLSNGTPANIISAVLTAGDWYVQGAATVIGTGATIPQAQVSVSVISATQGRDEATNYDVVSTAAFTGRKTINTPRIPISVPYNSTRTVFLVITPTISGGTATGYGNIVVSRR